MKKSILVVVAVLFSTSLFAQASVQNFEQLVQAFKAGKSVKSVIYYGKCKLSLPNYPSSLLSSHNCTHNHIQDG